LTRVQGLGLKPKPFLLGILVITDSLIGPQMCV
jgi:hypothetical protein